ncbi:hypothetical protein NDU88_005572 [Pleurodeles waltl]|uniref:Uncharacterized protein n=1 Tax=Pleurodeles waltl TaxID=8319 RepID=A0AAV7QF54_PLEWA|nr:hypothetical protein NDU88_005572 [Pleurodeles waltl]
MPAPQVSRFTTGFPGRRRPTPGPSLQSAEIPAQLAVPSAALGDPRGSSGVRPSRTARCTDGHCNSPLCPTPAPGWPPSSVAQVRTTSSPTPSAVSKTAAHAAGQSERPLGPHSPHRHSALLGTPSPDSLLVSGPTSAYSALKAPSKSLIFQDFRWAGLELWL